MGWFLGQAGADSVQPAVEYLNIISLVYILCYIGCSFVGYFRGIGRVEVPFLGSTLHIAIRVVLSFCLIRSLGLRAVAYSTGAGWLCVVVYQTITYWAGARGRKRRVGRTAGKKAAPPY